MIPLSTVDFGHYHQFFKRGLVRAIVHIDDTIRLFLRSSSVPPDARRDGTVLDPQGRLNGSLHFEEVRSVVVNGKSLDGPLCMQALSAQIVNLDFAGGTVELEVFWEPETKLREAEESWHILIKAVCVGWDESGSHDTVDLTQLNTKGPDACG